MRIETRDVGEVRILDLHGKLVIGDGDVATRQAVKLAASHKRTKILLNMQGVKAMDSSGLGELVALHKKAEAEGVELRLLHVEDKVQRLLKLTQLIGIFETFEDESEALASFQ